MSIFLKPDYGNSHLSVRQILSEPVLFLAFGFGSGLSRYMPGTMGTLAAIPIYWLMIHTLGDTGYLLAVIAISLSGIWICQRAADSLVVHDFGGIVWDEIAGLLISLYGLEFSWSALLAGFVLFRIFDIVKPWPISYLDQRVTGGFGIMLDDVIAALFANMILRFWF